MRNKVLFLPLREAVRISGSLQGHAEVIKESVNRTAAATGIYVLPRKAIKTSIDKLRLVERTFLCGTGCSIEQDEAPGIGGLCPFIELLKRIGIGWLLRVYP